MVRLMLLSTAMLFLGTPARAQQVTDESQKAVEFEERYNRAFMQRDPKIGSELPDLTAYDEQGQPFSLDSIRGKYTVVVFGCLT